MNDAGMATSSAARTIVSDVVSPLHHVRNGTEWIRAHCGGTLQVLRGEHTRRAKRTAADGCAEDVAYPVSAFSAVQATALGAASAYEFIFAFGTASTGRLCRQVRVLLAKEPFKVRKPSQLGWSVETPRPALAVCCLSRVAIGSVETEEAPLHL